LSYKQQEKFLVTAPIKVQVQRQNCKTNFAHNKNSNALSVLQLLQCEEIDN